MKKLILTSLFTALVLLNINTVKANDTIVIDTYNDNLKVIYKDENLILQNGNQENILGKLNIYHNARYGFSASGKYYAYSKDQTFNIYFYDVEKNQEILINKNEGYRDFTYYMDILWSKSKDDSFFVSNQHDGMGNLSLCYFENLEQKYCLKSIESISKDYLMPGDYESVEFIDDEHLVFTKKNAEGSIEKWQVGIDGNNAEMVGIVTPEEITPNYIKQAQTRGYLQGYPDGTLKLENPVNRAEFAKMLMMAFEQGDGNTESIKKFPDVKTGEWYAKPLAKAVELEIMQGYPDGNMKPAETIIMIEAVKMALETKYPEQDFTPSILSKWYSEYLSFIKENFPDISFVDGDLEHEMTRGECVELIEGIIEN